MKALIFGATGLTGAALLDCLLADPQVQEIHLFVRTARGKQPPKVTEIVINFEQLHDYSPLIKGDVVFNCLGTTLAKAGSQAAQQRIDRDYPIMIAEIAAQNGIPLMISVSSVGATLSGNFYLRTKAEMEAGVSAALGAGACFFLRPSLLMGKRGEFRLAERIAMFAMPIFDGLLHGGLRKYRGMKVTDLAKAMQVIAHGSRPSKTVLEFDEIMQLAKA